MKTPIAFLLCMAFAVAGCGDADSSTSDSTRQPASTGAPAQQADSGGPTQQAGATSTKPSRSASVRAKPKVTAPSGPPPKELVVEDLIAGNGAPAELGDELAVYFVSIRYVSGEHFETIWKPDEPFDFVLGPDDVSPGWVKGLQGMRVGGRRELIVPPQLTSRFGVPPGTGPEATLIYVIDLLEVA